jgi:hypothetical protein
MRSRTAVLPLLVALAASAAVAVVPSAATAQAPAPQCTYTPKLPKRVVVNANSVTFRTPVQISAKACATDFSASESLVNHGDSYELSWLYNSRTSINTAYATTIEPGTYRTAKDQKCSTTAADGSALTCAVEPGTTVIKFGSITGLAATRLKGANSKKVQFTVKATRYTSADAEHYQSVKVALQRYYSKAWHTIHTAKTNGKHGYVFTYSDGKTGSYRAVTAETAAAFSSVSKTVSR